ncbi:General substrate transporter [Rubrobacter xylanophilus DSM 9941]|uniref:Putative proline/betaine transporter n=1 Tax=Rubrobacter xylanophilus (strain DSM 9941 / JCM 11954 / NBRC 16129 / PRD-1) TaxID=266117 RepID=Q1AYT7_RUBXD|nr:MFS transporter [Rubrobacter xylanophilus]ABG03441.1 General substrate transporter [Rubrobacter xylanophilus DSM 9941]
MTATTAGGEAYPGRVRKKAVVAAVIGNFVEWYDFTIYGYLAVVIAPLFFPAENRLVSLMATFAVFGVAFLMRPVGALFFGNIGDKIGRRSTLSAVILIASGATFLIGLLPSYETIGILAPLLLVLARLVQGFAVGGEFGGATAFMVEYAPDERRGLYGSWQFFTQATSLVAGLLIAAGLTAAVSEEALYSWAWRVPFLITLPLGLIGLYMRLRLEDTPAFRAVQEHHEIERAPLLESLRTHGKDLLKVVGLTWPLTGLVYLLIFAPTYLSEQLDVPLSLGYTAVILGTSSWAVVVLLSALLSDRVGRRKPFLLASPVLAAVTAVPVFMMLQSGSFPVITLALVIVGSVVGISSGVYAAAMCEVFPTNVRYSSLSLGYSVAVSIFGGTTPFIFTALLAATGNPLSPAFYLVVAGLAGLVAALAFPETAREPLKET